MEEIQSKHGLAMILIVILFQLWTQPSVRILGFGREFAGFIPDPITDLIYNPAYLKMFGKDNLSFNGLQIYSSMKRLNSVSPDTTIVDLEFFEYKELLSLFVLYPKIGLAYRVGAWQRFDYRNYYELEPWLYGQEGFLCAFNIGKWIKLGAEYSFSWNNGPDWYNIVKYDSLNNPHEAAIVHLEWSNEGGLGIILSDNNKWQFAFAGKKNWEIDSFAADTTFWVYWPKNEASEWIRNYGDFQIISDFRIRIAQVSISADMKYCERNNHSTNSYRCSYRPGLGIIYQPNNNLLVIGAITYAWSRRDNFTYSQKIIIPVGFERKFGTDLNFRFGDTFIYEYYDGIYFYAKNKINLGLDLDVYKNLRLFFATQNLFENNGWLFGLNFSL